MSKISIQICFNSIKIKCTGNIIGTFEINNQSGKKLFLKVLRFGLVSLFNGISTLFRLFNAKAILLEEQ